MPSLGRSLLLLLVGLSLLSGGCKSLFSPKATQLVGTWTLSDIEGAEVKDADRALIGENTIEFQPDGTVLVEFPDMMELVEGRYQVEGRELVFTIDGREARSEILTLNRQKLITRPTLTPGDPELVTTYVRASR